MKVKFKANGDRLYTVLEESEDHYITLEIGKVEKFLMEAVGEPEVNDENISK